MEEKKSEDFIVLKGDGAIIRDNQYSDYNFLTNVKIPEGVKSIGYLAFYHCTKLTSVIIPDSVISIGRCAFNSFTKLKNINIKK